jgi:hypothetical protein
MEKKRDNEPFQPYRRIGLGSRSPSIGQRHPATDQGKRSGKADPCHQSRRWDDRRESLVEAKIDQQGADDGNSERVIKQIDLLVSGVEYQPV